MKLSMKWVGYFSVLARDLSESITLKAEVDYPNEEALRYSFQVSPRSPGYYISQEHLTQEINGNLFATSIPKTGSSAIAIPIAALVQAEFTLQRSGISLFIKCLGCSNQTGLCLGCPNIRFKISCSRRRPAGSGKTAPAISAVIHARTDGEELVRRSFIIFVKPTTTDSRQWRTP